MVVVKNIKNINVKNLYLYSTWAKPICQLLLLSYLQMLAAQVISYMRKKYGQPDTFTISVWPL
jgi:hypothetical protein